MNDAAIEIAAPTFTPHAFTADDDRALCAWAHEQAHAARAAGDEIAAQQWEREAFRIDPGPATSGPFMACYEVSVSDDSGALPIRLSQGVLVF